MPQPYDAFENLRKHNAVLHESVALHSGSNWRLGQTSAIPSPSIAITIRSVYISRMATRVITKRRGLEEWRRTGPFLPDAERERVKLGYPRRSPLFISIVPMHICAKWGKKSGIKAPIASRWTSTRLAVTRGSRRFTVSFT